MYEDNTMCKNQAKRPAFNDKDLKQVITALRNYEHTGSKQRTKQIRALMRDYVHFALLTGARTGTELANLRWCDIQTLTIENIDYLAITVNGKTGEREIISSTRLRRYLRRLQLRNKSKSDKVFVLPDGKQPKDLHGAFETFLKSINLHKNKQGKTYSLYSLRHTYATRKLLDGVSIHNLARQMGTSTVMLEKFYSKVTARMNAHMFG